MTEDGEKLVLRQTKTGQAKAIRRASCTLGSARAAVGKAGVGLAVALLVSGLALEREKPRWRRLQRVLTEERPAGDDSRRPYLVAAKLLFLLPRRSDEAVSAYLDRVAQRVREQCR